MLIASAGIIIEPSAAKFAASAISKAAGRIASVLWAHAAGRSAARIAYRKAYRAERAQGEFEPMRETVRTVEPPMFQQARQVLRDLKG